MELIKKKTVLVLIDWYLPGRKAGGPVKSIESLVWAMKDHFHFKILTTDTDLGETEPYKNIVSGKWLKNDDGSETYYLKKSDLSSATIEQVINSVPHDVLYLNSYYSKWFSIIPLRLVKKARLQDHIVLAPRGMLSNGAIALKRMKKKFFIQYSKIFGLHSGITWHATYMEEVKEIKKVYGDKADVRLCSNFSKPLLVSAPAKEKKSGELKLFFLSRVARVKNLHIALASLARLKVEGKVSYDIFGSIEDENYKAECTEIIRSLPKNIQVAFKGELMNNKIGEVISHYHFLFLPTSNENFGHSIFESLQCACPVIISNKTPWRDLKERNCGWDVEPLPANYTHILAGCLEMDDRKYKEMTAATAKLVKEKLNPGNQKEQAIALFNRIL